MSFIGVDLHTTSFTVCRLDADGGEAFETYQLAAADLQRFCLSLDADDEIAVEATGNSAWFREEIISCVGRVVVVNPKQFGVQGKSVLTVRPDPTGLCWASSPVRPWFKACLRCPVSLAEVPERGFIA